MSIVDIKQGREKRMCNAGNEVVLLWRCNQLCVIHNAFFSDWFVTAS